MRTGNATPSQRDSPPAAAVSAGDSRPERYMDGR